VIGVAVLVMRHKNGVDHVISYILDTSHDDPKFNEGRLSMRNEWLNFRKLLDAIQSLFQAKGEDHDNRLFFREA
jgi:hypothetical protein